MKRRLTYIVLLSALAIAGCDNSPRLDATSEKTITDSMKAMTAKLTDAQKREFAVDTAAAIGPEAMQAGIKNSLSKDKAPGGQTAMYKSLNGLSVDEIHAKAEENRKKRAEEKQKR